MHTDSLLIGLLQAHVDIVTLEAVHRVPQQSDVDSRRKNPLYLVIVPNAVEYEHVVGAFGPSVLS